MADTTQSSTTTGSGNEKAVSIEGVGDRVHMLSLKADGTPDQTNPSFIDAEASEAATVEQFKQQAVSAKDVELRTPEPPEEGDSGADQPEIKKLVKAHEGAAKKAESAAKAALKNLG